MCSILFVDPLCLLYLFFRCVYSFDWQYIDRTDRRNMNETSSLVYSVHVASLHLLFICSRVFFVSTFIILEQRDSSKFNKHESWTWKKHEDMFLISWWFLLFTFPESLHLFVIWMCFLVFIMFLHFGLCKMPKQETQQEWTPSWLL